MTDCIPIHIHSLGRVDYLNTWQAMQSFTEQRTPETPDELWIVEHPPVYTQGLNGKAEHLLNPNPKIPIVQTDRGGQITYHGPGQLVIYVLIDLKRRKLGVRALVSLIENSLIELLANLNIESTARADAPGVYVKGKKIASLGLKIRKQKSYHGLALNIDMDLTPFQAINPCGLQGMQMTQLKDEFTQLSDNPLPSFDKIGAQLTEIISAQLISS
ncbi:lipoyl(octanoyl) transferase LipB [Thiomicrorhabdus indica]|uniref:lipoyl(octanoyl) transferase LipB n=1 Tax=Thiomicrorhabdus indica TaxID=2267253 RepID=UPI00102D89FD|nr:lipoyl(octanoyl) transferase LipB [Thiomicrorhabdus indica]